MGFIVCNRVVPTRASSDEQNAVQVALARMSLQGDRRHTALCTQPTKSPRFSRGGHSALIAVSAKGL